MIVSETLGGTLYTATEVSELIGVTRETLGLYAKRAGIEDRRVQRVRYYTEEEIREILQVSSMIRRDKSCNNS